MQLLAPLVTLFFCLAGAAAGFIHDHHHLINDMEEGARKDLLEGATHRRSSRSSAGPEACNNAENPMAEAILQGVHRSYAFGGIPEDCGEGFGCKSDYWGKWCRFRHHHAPQCPQELQEDLQLRLRSAAVEGHTWARDILLVRPCEIFPYLEGRTLWVIGDSMSKDFAFAFQCFMLEYWDHEDTGRWPRNQSTSPDVSDDPAMMQDLLSELSKLEPGQAMSPWYLQWCVPMYGGTRMCFLRANTGSFLAESLMPLLPRLTQKEDIVLLNFGLHTNDNGSLWNYIQELKAFGAEYWNRRQDMPQFIWRQTSAQHFDTPIGEWMPDRPQQEQKCVPIEGFELRADGTLGALPDSPLLTTNATDWTNAMDTLLRGGRRNVRSEFVMGRLGIPIMHIWNYTVPYWDFHRFYHDPEDGTVCSKVDCDCTHICVPSWHQMWMASLQRTLALIGPKGNGRYEEWGEPADHPIPGINVPLRYLPDEHTIATNVGLADR